MVKYVCVRHIRGNWKPDACHRVTSRNVSLNWRKAAPAGTEEEKRDGWTSLVESDGLWIL